MKQIKLSETLKNSRYYICWVRYILIECHQTCFHWSFKTYSLIITSPYFAVPHVMIISPIYYSSHSGSIHTVEIIYYADCQMSSRKQTFWQTQKYMSYNMSQEDWKININILFIVHLSEIVWRSHSLCRKLCFSDSQCALLKHCSEWKPNNMETTFTILFLNKLCLS